MTRTIFKYPVGPGYRFSHDIPKDHAFLDVQVQRDEPMMWFQVESTAPIEREDFAVVGTGSLCPADEGEPWWYLGTFQVAGGNLVWHLFMRNRWAE